MSEIRLIIADDHELFRNGLEELLKKHHDINVVKSVGDGKQFLGIWLGVIPFSMRFGHP